MLLNSLLGIIGGFTGGALIVANVIGFPEVELGETAVGILGAEGVANLELMDAFAGEPYASLGVGGIMGVGPGAIVGGLTGYILNPVNTPKRPCKN